jgi:hypothetical protein
MKYLLGKTQIAGKQFTYDDVTEKKATGFGQDYYGGNVQYFGKTKEGFLLCVKKNKPEIIDIFVDEDSLTAEGLKLLLKEQGEEVPFEHVEEAIDIEKMGRDELIALAKKLGIEGKLATFKTATLIEKIKEAKA